MKALVTGAGGFLGRAVVEALAARNPELLRCAVRSQVPPGLRTLSAQNKRVELADGNLLSRDHIRRMLDGIDTVYHLAAGTSGAAADLFLNTVVVSQRLLEAVAESTHARKIVLVSSFSVYAAGTERRGALIDENFPIEPAAELRDSYCLAKTWQDNLFRDFHKRHGCAVVIVRPGVIYGPGGVAISPRVGISLPGVFLHAGRRNLLPLTYVTNCAEAIIVASESSALYDVVNVVDDDLPTCKEYLRRYRVEIKKIRYLTLPYFGIQLLAKVFVWYNRFSKGQLPAVITPYNAAALWKGNRFTNSHLKELGWKQGIPTGVGLTRTFEYLKSLSQGS